MSTEVTRKSKCSKWVVLSITGLQTAIRSQGRSFLDNVKVLVSTNSCFPRGRDPWPGKRRWALNDLNMRSLPESEAQTTTGADILPLVFAGTQEIL